jgi:hypothetical protein
LKLLQLFLKIQKTLLQGHALAKAGLACFTLIPRHSSILPLPAKYLTSPAGDPACLE